MIDGDCRAVMVVSGEWGIGGGLVVVMVVWLVIVMYWSINVGGVACVKFVSLKDICVMFWLYLCCILAII